MYYHHVWGPSWLIVAAIAIVPFWRICKRVGHSPWLGLLIVVPLANLIFTYYLAFGAWPSDRKPTTPA